MKTQKDIKKSKIFLNLSKRMIIKIALKTINCKIIRMINLKKFHQNSKIQNLISNKKIIIKISIINKN